jgi:hypothetical protein
MRGCFHLLFSQFTALAWQNITFVDPHLDANDAKCCVGLGLTIINVGAQGLQRNTSLDFFLSTSDFRAT